MAKRLVFIFLLEQDAQIDSAVEQARQVGGGAASEAMESNLLGQIHYLIARCFVLNRQLRQKFAEDL